MATPTKLTKTARTILRSRLRRHNDALLIAQHIEAAYGARNISDLTTPQLIETATKFDAMTIPTVSECEAFDAETSAGRGGAVALHAADQMIGNLNNMKWRTVGQAAPKGMGVVLGTDADTDNEPDTDDDDDQTSDQTQPEADDQTAGTPAPSEAKAEGSDLDATVDAEVKTIMGKMGAGDFAGYQDALKDLARRAHKPAQVIEVPAVDASKIKGAVPKRIGVKTMLEAGLPASLTGVAVEKTALPVYDTADAPKVDAVYRWPEHTPMMLSTWRRGGTVFGHGPAGTGKTELAKQVAARWGRRFVRISCDDQTEAATLVGMTVPSKDGGTTWQDGQLTAAIRVPGAVILVDEPSVARPGALFVLQAVLDGDKRLHIAETGEVVPVAPDVIFMLADNTNGTGDMSGQYEATRRLNRATLDRSSIHVAFQYLDPAEEASVLASKSGLNKRATVILAKFAALTRSKAQAGEVSHGIGLRRMLALAELLADGADPTIAFQLAVIESAPYDDKEPLRQFWTGAVDAGTLAAAAKGQNPAPAKAAA